MPALRRPIRPLFLAVAVVALLAIPVLAAGPSDPSAAPTGTSSPEVSIPGLPSTAPTDTASPAPSTSAAPSASMAPTITSSPDRQEPSTAPGGAKPGNGNRGDAESQGEETVTVTGLLGTRAGVDDRIEYTLTAGSSVVRLDAGPPWFYGAKHPLQPFVGKRVTIVGERSQGSDELEVRSVDGTVIRGEGKPPWAGGWKRVGKIHPGWSQEKWDRWQAKLTG